jgi:hypothetical protein
MDNNIFELLRILLIGVIIIISLALFRNPLSKFIEKIISISFHKKDGTKQTGLDINTEKVVEKNNEDLLSIPSEKKLEITENASVFFEKNNFEEKRSDLYQLVSNNKAEDAKQLYNSILSSLDDEDQIFEWRLAYIHSRYLFGFEKDMRNYERLFNEFSEDKKKKNRILYVQGIAYLFFQKYEEAEHIVKKLIENSDDEEDKLNAFLLMSDTKAKKENTYSSMEYLFAKVKEVNINENKYEIYKKIFDLMKEENKFFAFIAISKALYYKPNQKDDLFEAGYNSENKYCSLFFYTRLLQIDSSNQNGLNNIGVAYNNLNLKINGVNSYKQAVKFGNTLSMSNIAIKYIEEGFYEEAKNILNEGLNKEDIHENIYRDLSTLEIKKNEEEKTKEKLFNSYEKYIAFINENAEFFFTRRADKIFIGSYQSANGEQLTIKEKENKFEIICILNNDTYKAISNIDYLGSELKLTKETSYSFSNNTKECTLIINDNTTISLFLIDEDRTTQKFSFEKKC